MWALLLAATFHGLGDLPGGEFRSEALAVSADGTAPNIPRRKGSCGPRRTA
jgi:hypothetical protein